MADATSSFIPKNSKVKKPRASKRIYIFSYVSYVFFFGTLLVVLGTYVYSAQVNNTLAEVNQQLADERNEFSESDIAEIRDLEKRIITAERLVAESSAPSKIFTALESAVVDTVSFHEFEYERLENNDFKISFSGFTDTFDSAIFQRDILMAAPILSSAAFSSYVYGESEDGESPRSTDGQLEFVFEGSANTSLFPYEPTAQGFEEEFEQEFEANENIENAIPDEDPLINDEVIN